MVFSELGSFLSLTPASAAALVTYAPDNLDEAW